MYLPDLEGRLGLITSRGVAVALAASCAERALPLCRLGMDASSVGSLEQSLQSAWAEIADAPPGRTNSLIDAGMGILDRLVDADFGEHHVAIFDAVTVVGHSVWCAGEREINACNRETILSSRAMFRLLQGVYHDQAGTFQGWSGHDSVTRERERQLRDLTALADAGPGRVVEVVRERAKREGPLLVDGVVNRKWTDTLPPEGHPSLF